MSVKREYLYRLVGNFMTNVNSIYGHENNFPIINSCQFIHKTWGGVWVVIAISSLYEYGQAVHHNN